MIINPSSLQPTAITTTTAGTSNIWPGTTTYGHYSWPGITPSLPNTFEQLKANLSKLDDKFLHIKDYIMFTLTVGDQTYRLIDILKSSNNIAFIECAGEVMIVKAVWSAIESYIEGGGFAGMTPGEYLDKIFCK